MTATYEQARDDILGVFHTAWSALTPALNGGLMLPVRWPGREVEGAPDPDKAFAELFLTLTPGGRQALSGANGQRRFERVGLLTVRIKTPIADGQSLSLSHQLAKIVTDAYEGKDTPAGVWFRNVRVQEIGAPTDGSLVQRDSERYQINVYVEFIYSEVK